MKWREIEWRGCRPPLNDGVVENAERELGIRFPDDFKDCLKHCHGGAPVHNRFHFQDAHGELGSCLGVLMSLEASDPFNIISVMDMLSDDLPLGLVPFGDDGGGDLMCFDYRDNRGTDKPSVVYWGRTSLLSDNVAHLSDSFLGFLKMLH